MKTFNNSRASQQDLDNLAVPEMTPDEFARHTLLIPVRASSSPQSRARLEVAPGCESRMEELRSEFARVMVQSELASKDRTALVNRAVSECMSIDLNDHIWTSRIPRGKQVMLVNADLLQRVAERDLVEFVHKTEVESAAAQGRPVAPEALAYYQSKSGARLKSANAANAGASAR